MSEPAIRVDNVAKLYRLGRREERAQTLVGATARLLATPWRNYRQLRRLTHFEDAAQADDILWALRDVSFDVAPGEVVGLIGRNGAGKSTLLKILSRITPPTRGRIVVHGRLASLLEVGTGFHPELSGRDNVFLNGAILGMTQREIQRKFDEIVAFAEIENFIDTPVKRYSSGMYVRLAFAVAAHLEPEILIVDEVLAVGDAQFQKKCLGKMREVSSQGGRTILFVSHNMDSILRLCSRAVLLSDGQVHTDGPARTAVEQYMFLARSRTLVVSFAGAPRLDILRGSARLESAEDRSGAEPPWSLPYGREVRLLVRFTLTKPLEFWRIGLALSGSDGMEIATWQSDPAASAPYLAPGRYACELRYPGLRLIPDVYFLGVGIRSNFGMEDYLSEAVYFEVLSSPESAQTGVDTFRGRIVPEVAVDVHADGP
jgi:lipopolysaccharide transport system ATP-binding protein